MYASSRWRGRAAGNRDTFGGLPVAVKRRHAGILVRLKKHLLLLRGPAYALWGEARLKKHRKREKETTGGGEKKIGGKKRSFV